MFLKRDGWVNLNLERMTFENLHDPCTTPTRASVCKRFVLIQQLLGDFVLICDIFGLFGDVASKQEVSKLDLLSKQMRIIVKILRLQCLPSVSELIPS